MRFLAGILAFIFPLTSFAEVRIIQQRRVVVVAVPVSNGIFYNVGAGYGGERREAKKLSDEDVKRIADEVVRAIAAKELRTVGGSDAPTKSYDAEAFKILNANCIQCHKPGASKPGLQLFTAERTLFVKADKSAELSRRSRILDAVKDGRMPKGGHPLGEAQKELLENWKKELE